MVSRTKKALEQYVQTFGNVFRKNHVPAVRAVKQPAQQLPGLQNLLLHLVSRTVAAPIDVGAAVGHVMVHRLGHSGGLGKGSGRVIQVNSLQGTPSRRSIVLA